MAGLLKPTYIPAREQRELRDLTRYRKKLIRDIASNKNRIIRILKDCNVKLSCVLSDTSGVTATKLIDKLCDGQAITMADIDEVYHPKIGASKEELFESCNGYITDHHIYLLKIIRENTRQIESLIGELDEKIKQVLAPYESILERLREIPGLNRKSVEDLIAEIGLDMNVFPDDKHLCSWVGVSPGNNKSAGKKSGRTPHGNKQAKTILTQSAWAASRTKDTFYHARYHRLAARQGKKKVIAAIAHSILKSVYHVLKDDLPYRELGADYLQADGRKTTTLLKRRIGKDGVPCSSSIPQGLKRTRSQT